MGNSEWQLYLCQGCHMIILFNNLHTVLVRIRSSSS